MNVQPKFENLLSLLKNRFEKNMHRHPRMDWKDVETRLNSHPYALNTIALMEETGGEPDVIMINTGSQDIIYCDCSKETPKGRKSLCYDMEALKSRKTHPPQGNVIDHAAELGITILNEEEYFVLQSLETFDTKTSSWLKTPEEIRKLGGAIFGDNRFGRTFIYHNGAESYYSSRGYRGKFIL